MKEKILFVVESNVIDGEIYLGSSNDLLLISEALKAGKEVYVTTPDELIKQSKAGKFFAKKLSKIAINQLNQFYEAALHQETINTILKLPSSPSQSDCAQSLILFENAQNEEIDLKSMLIFNRTEPVSLSDKFYDILIQLQNDGVFITPNPELNKILGDKGGVYSIHHSREIGGLNLALQLTPEDLAQGKNKISFATEIIAVSNNQLSAQQLSDFYSKLQNALLENDQQFIQELRSRNYSDIIDFLYFDTNQKDAKQRANLALELEKLYQGALQYAQFHNQNLGNNSIAKPANYFGGTGIIPTTNIAIDEIQAIQNIIKIFQAIERDCANSSDKRKASLSSIIVQERATEAHLGDLRIVIAGGNLQGIFNRVNPSFSKSNANNMHHGGHPESLFGNYNLSYDGIDQMIADMLKNGLDHKSEEIKKAKALYGLLEAIFVIQNIDIFKNYPIIGADALLTKMPDGSYRYGITEINLTSPMGQIQIITTQIASINKELAEKIFGENFATQNNIKSLLLENQELKDAIIKNIKEALNYSPAKQTLNCAFAEFKSKKKLLTSENREKSPSNSPRSNEESRFETSTLSPQTAEKQTQEI